MNHEELDRLWFKAMEDSIRDGEMVARYHFAALVAAAEREDLLNTIDALYDAEHQLRCSNCASLEAQNTELDRKLADLEQTSLELCETCGWRTVIPGEGCLNCARSKLAELERKPLTEEEIKRIDDSTHFHESPDWSLRFARAIEKAHGIKERA